jgi:anti-sigma B factor antagonist
VDHEVEGECTLDMEVARDESEVALVLSGELDVSTAPRLRDQIQLLIESGAIRFTCDIAGLRYLDSSGLSVLLMAHKRLEKLGGTLILQSPVPNVRRLFEVTGIDDYLVIQPPSIENPLRREKS